MFVDPLNVLMASEPFPHFSTAAVFSDAEWLQRLGQWLHESEYWHLEPWDNYYGFDFSSHQLSGAAVEITSPEVISDLLNICEKAFGECFFAAVMLGAHKLVKNQYIAVHNDSGNEALHTHRLTVQIPGPEQVEGGDLLLFREKTSSEPKRVYSPRPNTGFGFEFKNNSFHAVSPVTHGARYSLVINLKASRGLTQNDIFAKMSPEYTRRLFWANEASKRSDSGIRTR